MASSWSKKSATILWDRAFSRTAAVARSRIIKPSLQATARKAKRIQQAAGPGSGGGSPWTGVPGAMAGIVAVAVAVVGGQANGDLRHPAAAEAEVGGRF